MYVKFQFVFFNCTWVYFSTVHLFTSRTRLVNSVSVCTDCNTTSQGRMAGCVRQGAIDSRLTKFAVEECQHFIKIHPTQRFLHPIPLLNPSDKVLVIFQKLLPGRQMLQANLQHIKTKSVYIGNV